MKRIFTISTILLFSFIITGSISGQDTKKEQHIKIVTVDKTGNKVEIDTLIKDGATMDTIVLKDGKVVILGNHHGMEGKLAHISEGKGQIYVTVSSDSDDKKGEKVFVTSRSAGTSGAEFTIVTDDNDSKGGKIVYIKDGKTIVKEGEEGKIMTWTSKDSEKGEKRYDVKVITNDEGERVEKTKYVIAKDGMVITVEGSDETKVKEMIKEIESKLGVVKEDDSKKTVIKEETKKTTKK